MLFPELIEGIGNEVLVCALSLGGIIFCVALRLYNHGIYSGMIHGSVEANSMNSNSAATEQEPVQLDTNEDVSAYQTGVLDTAVMESMRDSERHLESGTIHFDFKRISNRSALPISLFCFYRSASWTWW